MLIENVFSGIRLSDIVGNQRVSKLYIGYSRRSAVKLFKQYIRELKNADKS